MSKRIGVIWIAAFAMASVCSVLGLLAHPKMWGFYIQLPGMAVGLFIGYFAHSGSVVMTRALVIGTTVILNSLCYFWIYRFIAWCCSRKEAIGGNF